MSLFQKCTFTEIAYIVYAWPGVKKKVRLSTKMYMCGRGLNAILHLSFALNRVTKQKTKTMPSSHSNVLKQPARLYTVGVSDTRKALLLLVVSCDRCRYILLRKE